MGPLTLSSTILLPLRPPPLPFHGFTQQFVDPRLVTASLALQPRQHIGIHANRHRPLDGAVKLPHHGAPPFPYFRRIRQIDLVIRHPRQRRKLLCYSPGNLLHGFFLLRDSSASRRTISRLVLSRVSLRALRTKLSSISIFVLPISKACTISEDFGVCFILRLSLLQLSAVDRRSRPSFSTDFHNSFESYASRKPFPSANLNPTVSNSDAHSSDNIVILDSHYFLCHHVLC